MALPVQSFLAILVLAGGSGELQATKVDSVLTLDAALEVALAEDDPSVRRFEETARALDDRAVAESQLPDPQIGVAMVNLPTSIDFNQENMTQLQTRLRQAFPAGRTLALRGERRRAESRGARLEAQVQRLRILLDTRLAWLEMFYWRRADATIADSLEAVAALESTLRADYAAGRGTAQAMMRTRLELSLLEDRRIEAGRRHEVARAGLARYVGAGDARRALPELLPVLKVPEPVAVLREGLARHPAVAAADASLEARAREVEIARQRYKPGWAAEAAYGVRSGNRMVGGRDDFLTFGVTLDLPIFTGKRQDRAVSAARHEREASRLDKDRLLLDLEAELERSHAAWSRLGERIALYREAAIGRAEETSRASMSSYESGTTDFAELIRARLAELDVELVLIRLEVDRAQAQASLLFFEGEF